MSAKPATDDAKDELLSPFRRLYALTRTPYPALANAALLTSTPVLSPSFKVPPTQSPALSIPMSRVFSKSSTARIGITTKTALFFSTMQAIGAYMIYDNDLENGAGFIATWSALYLIVGGKKSFSALRYGRTWPLVLSSVSLANAVLYGQRFLATGFQ
ncbi:ALI_HP2_G0021580.mRNA.1.CDS.1 [Saccharomyces cerevisiae]|nr:ALI_HP2_G0021580.mRNA.1.CDS.1 [Saccharomyces cerevisiae]CAI6431985.1 ALI_HP2_G0021580.mRNA.1.CDS.1 [Saccharomyces cerevisiae]CAI6461097.1 ALI_HP1_G0028000.mRNA.1.CDS.1 [Saccharomyces cerevisiae]CAI6613652.1 ALI_collapsed_G0029930.mRNA.1.CDS.1 [Saccharomyces cerevisiae]